MAAFLTPPGLKLGAARPPRVCDARRGARGATVRATAGGPEADARPAAAAAAAAAGAPASSTDTPAVAPTPLTAAAATGAAWARLGRTLGTAATAAVLGCHVASGGRLLPRVGGRAGAPVAAAPAGGGPTAGRPAAAVAATVDGAGVGAPSTAPASATATALAATEAGTGRAPTVGLVPPPSLAAGGAAAAASPAARAAAGSVAYQTIDLGKLGIKYDDLINDRVLMSDKTVAYNEAELEIMELEDLQQLDGWRRGLKLGVSLGVSATGLAVLYKGGVLWERWIKEQEKKDMEDEIELTGTFIAPSAVRLAEEEEAAAKKKKKRKNKNKGKDGGGDKPKPTSG